MSALALLDEPEDDLAAEFAATAERKWTRQLIVHARGRLFAAGETGSHRVAREETSEAADALHAAGKLAPEPHCTALLRLSILLNETPPDGIGHPDGNVLEAVSDEAARILKALGGSAR